MCMHFNNDFFLKFIQLPAEWQKYAYGQTEDQKDLTQKARSFLRCRPRVLQFEKQTLD